MTEEEICQQIDALNAERKVISDKIKSLRDKLPNKYVIQRTWVKECVYHGGSMSKGFVQFCSRAGSQEYTFASNEKSDWHNHVFRSRRDAESTLKVLLEHTTLLHSKFVEECLHYEVVPL